MKNRLLYRILGSYAVLILITAAVMGLMYARQIKVDIVEEIRNDLIAQMRITALLGMSDIEKKLPQLAEISHSRVTLVDASGRVRGDSEKDLAQMDSHLNRPEIQEARVRGMGDAIRYSRTLGVDMLYVAFPVSAEGREVKGYIRFARPLFDVKKSIDEQYANIYKIILIAVIPAFIIAFLLAKRFISPVEKVISYTHKVSSGEGYGTLLIESHDDVGQLEKDINRIVEDQQEKLRTAREEKAKLEATFASMTDGILIVDDQYRVEYGNEHMKGILGAGDISGILGKTPLEAFRNAELQDAIELFRNSGGPVSLEVTQGGEMSAILDVSISAVKGLPAGEQKTLIVFHDVTRIKKLEKVREDFVANVTHEIKTPLTSIIGFIETLEDGAIREEETAKKFLHIISENAHRLGRLVDDLLTLSSIELGEMEFQFESVSIADVVEVVLPMFEARAAEKFLTIDKRIQAELPLIPADSDKLAQILVNILDNAVKFTPAGGNISITAKCDSGSVTVVVSDTGTGIPKMEIPRLGERFYRVDKTRSREMGGTGLGLSIVKHLMKAHNGSIEIESQMGKGTSVFLRFPSNQAPKS
ncbi:MAG TPA: ATP-binding protein [Syntrophales bacterium]|nr:ATP-binding protein [Syntrophales bacterium]